MAKKRKGGFLMFGSHEVKRQELEELSQGQPEVVIVGTGTGGADRIAPERETWAGASDVVLLAQPSYDAVAKEMNLRNKRRRLLP